MPILIARNVSVNGTDFRVTLTDQTIRQVSDLKSLYAIACDDPESFDQVGSKISALISDIASTASPSVSDGDLDGFIQEVIKIVDNRKAIVEELASESRRSRSRRRVKSKRSRSA